MADMVEDIAITFPERASGGFGASPSRHRPRAEVIFKLDDGTMHSGWVPSRVARRYQKQEPDLPCSYRSAMDDLLDLEERICFTMLMEIQSRREHSSQEIRDKLLQAGFRAQSVDRAVERAQQLNYLNDTRFMTTFIEERLRRGWGKRKIELELKRRGVNPSDLFDYPERFFSPEEDFERARAILARKSVPVEHAFEKLVRRLMSKGFSYDIASRAARERMAQEEEICAGSHELW